MEMSSQHPCLQHPHWRLWVAEHVEVPKGNKPERTWTRHTPSATRLPKHLFHIATIWLFTHILCNIFCNNLIKQCLIQRLWRKQTTQANPHRDCGGMLPQEKDKKQVGSCGSQGTSKDSGQMLFLSLWPSKYLSLVSSLQDTKTKNLLKTEKQKWKIHSHIMQHMGPRCKHKALCYM